MNPNALTTIAALPGMGGGCQSALPAEVAKAPERTAFRYDWIAGDIKSRSIGGYEVHYYADGLWIVDADTGQRILGYPRKAADPVRPMPADPPPVDLSGYVNADLCDVVRMAPMAPYFREQLAGRGPAPGVYGPAQSSGTIATDEGTGAG